MNQEQDVIIIGAGVIGAAIAFEMAKAGYHPLVVESRPTSGAGSTANSCALIRHFYSTWDGVAIAHESALYWADWADYLELGDGFDLARFVNTGTVIIKCPSFDHEKSLANMHDVGVPVEDWDLETLKEKVPDFKLMKFWPPSRPEDDVFWNEPTEPLEGAIHTPTSGYVNDPQLSVLNLQWAAEKRGARFLFNAEVKEILTGPGGVTGVGLADGRRLEASRVINAAGPHSFIINRLAGVEDEMNIKTKALRHEVHFVPASPAWLSRKYHWSDSDLATYARPEMDSQILIGNEDPDCDPVVYVDPDAFYAGEGAMGENNQVTKEQFKAQVYRLAKRITDLPVPDKPKGVVDLYDTADDWIPIYDKSSLPGFYMAVGTSGNQYKNAPVVGQMMTDLIEAVEQGRDHDADPLQFTCRKTGLVLNMGFYSRLREINRESSFSVRG